MSDNEREIPSQSFLQSRPVQIQAVAVDRGHNSGPHSQLYVLCEDGSIWIQYSSDGFANVPTDGKFHLVQPPDGFEIITTK